ncbi:MAG: hypothetical protein IJC68_01780, partial [Firmicutes bacterium]|nr:hypothetical protein [Bacillota bacterium]
MAKKERRNFGRKTLATIMALLMVFGLVQVPVFAQGTAADPYDVGDIAYSANRNTKPEGEIPAYTAWEYVKTHSAQYDCGKEEHTHSRFCDRWGCNEEEHRHDDSCISVPARVEWKLGIDDNADSALHLDIHIGLKATYTLDGVPYTSDVQLTKEDYTSGRLQISSTAPFEITGTEIYDAGQRRFNGSFPVGTSANPVYYTIKLVKNVDFNVKGETVTLPMTFEKTVQFWSEDNICETILQSRDYNKWKSGLFIRGGMDFKLGASEAEGSTAPTEATLTIQKNVSGITLEAAKEYVFGVYSGNEKIDTVE